MSDYVQVGKEPGIDLENHGLLDQEGIPGRITPAPRAIQGAVLRHVSAHPARGAGGRQGLHQAKALSLVSERID